MPQRCSAMARTPALRLLRWLSGREVLSGGRSWRRSRRRRARGIPAAFGLADPKRLLLNASAADEPASVPLVGTIAATTCARPATQSCGNCYTAAASRPRRGRPSLLAWRNTQQHLVQSLRRISSTHTAVQKYGYRTARALRLRCNKTTRIF